MPETVGVQQQWRERSTEPSRWVVDLQPFDRVRTVKSGPLFSTEIYRDRSTEVEIAVKCFRQLDQSSEHVFFREVEALVRLDHPCVVPFFGYVLQTPESGAKIATHFMFGGSLGDVLESRPSRWDGTAKSIVVAGIVEGMKVMHDSGIIHRDLKPSNVLLDADRRPRLRNFGSSRDQYLTCTLTGEVGTPWYMAPELYDEDDYDEKVDIYSFALMLYEVVVGRPVFPRTLTARSSSRTFKSMNRTYPSVNIVTARKRLPNFFAPSTIKEQ
jgi:serine/threonine protein kinase